MDLLEAIGNFFRDWWTVFVEFVEACFQTAWDAWGDYLAWVVEQLLEVGSTIVSGLNSMITFNPLEYLSFLPGEVTNVMGLIGMGTATSMIAAAIGVRLLLQLIPFVRLGS